ncbi:MAG: hypothetical protein ACUVWZ_03995 [Anaerolineae bacterium]
MELSNEPAAEYYLCPCVASGSPPCDAISGPNQPACLLGPNSLEFVVVYSDLLFTAAISGSVAMIATNPQALLVTGALEMAATRSLSTQLDLADPQLRLLSGPGQPLLATRWLRDRAAVHRLDADGQAVPCAFCLARN